MELVDYLIFRDFVVPLIAIVIYVLFVIIAGEGGKKWN